MIVAGAVIGCGDPPPLQAPTAPRAKVRLRAFTETAPASEVVALGGDVFIVKGATLERWRPDGSVLEMSATHGLPGPQVLALAGDVRRDRVWVVTNGGLGYYDGKSDTFETLPPSPLAADLGLAIEAAPVSEPTVPPVEPKPPPTVVAAAASDDGVWIGHPRGLFYASRKGGWASTPIVDPITALHLGHDGWLWVGTDRGLIGRDPSGRTFTFGPHQGCDVTIVRWIAPAPGANVLVVGEDASGHQRVAIGRAASWRSFKLSPSTRWLAGAAVGERLVVVATDGLYALAAGPPSTTGPLRRDGVRLLSVAGNDDPSFHIDRLPAALPAGARTLAASGADVLIGTDELGVARQPLDSARPTAWYRRAAMLDRAGSLTVLCQAKDDCWIATGAPRAWRWHGGVFIPAGPVDEVVLGMARSRDGTLYGFHRAPDGKAIDLSQIEGETWTPINIHLETPGTGPEVSFAKFAPDGLLWVGLRYRDDGDLRPWGIATVDLDTGAVAYHHMSGDPADRKLGILPVPTSVVDVAFLREAEVWMASQQGAVRMQGERVTIWNESSQLESELLNAVAVTSGGLVFVATADGVGTFDGERWRFPPELRFATNDLVLGGDGRLWLATERGLAIFDGKKVRRLDVRRGMVENQILDVTLDEFGRVWTRGPRSLAVVTP
ncbi:MAG: hypothetical protein IPL61_04845 [Myxococcales bacterium]|nr:hypothetical protein [Myxococcales bacterium]